MNNINIVLNIFVRVVLIICPKIIVRIVNAIAFNVLHKNMKNINFVKIIYVWIVTNQNVILIIIVNYVIIVNVIITNVY